MNTNLTQITKAYIGSSAFLVIAGEGAVWFLDRYNWVREPDYLLPVAAAIAIPAGYLGLQLMARGMRLSQPPAKRGPVYAQPSTFASAVGWVVGKPISHTWGMEDTTQPMTTITVNGKPLKEEFVFRGNGLWSEIPEGRLYAFCKTAWARQQAVEAGRLAANKILSRRYFTQNARPRYPTPDYLSIIAILELSGLIVNRWKGGQLTRSPGMALERAKMRWGNRH